MRFKELSLVNSVFLSLSVEKLNRNYLERKLGELRSWIKEKLFASSSDGESSCLQSWLFCSLLSLCSNDRSVRSQEVSKCQPRYIYIVIDFVNQLEEATRNNTPCPFLKPTLLLEATTFATPRTTPLINLAHEKFQSSDETWNAFLIKYSSHSVSGAKLCTKIEIRPWKLHLLCSLEFQPCNAKNKSL